MGSITTRSYRGEEFVTVDDLDAVSDLLADGHDVVWIDLDDPSKEQLNGLADELGLHHLAVEDALDPHQRDKYVHYEQHVFLVAHAVELDVEEAGLRTIELDVFIGDRWLVTVHQGGDPWIDRVVARWDKARRFAGCRVGVAVYALLDVSSTGTSTPSTASSRSTTASPTRSSGRTRSSRPTTATGSRCAARSTSSTGSCGR